MPFCGISIYSPAMKKYCGFATDMDGTITDTTPVWEEATRRAFEAHKIVLTPHLLTTFYGRTLFDVLGDAGYDHDTILKVRATRDMHLPELMAEKAQWLPGAPDFLDTMRPVPSAIVTNSRDFDMHHVHKKLGVRDYVDHVVTIDKMRPKHKPHPHPLRQACKRLRLQIRDVLYMGDQKVDKIAALRAGMDFVLFRGPHTPKDLRADWEVESYDEILDRF